MDPVVNLEFEERKRNMLGNSNSHYRAILERAMSDEQKEIFKQVEREAAELELEKKRKYHYRSPTYAK